MNTYDLKLGNCYELIKEVPDNSIDLIITDPPYKLGTCDGGGLFKPIEKDNPNNPYKRSDTNSIKKLKKLGCADFNATEFLDLIKPKMKQFYGYFFCNKPLLPEYLNYAVKNNLLFEIIIYYKDNPIPARNNHYLPDTEYCVLLREAGTYFAKDAEFDDYRKLYRVSSSGKKLHPAEKPVKMLERFVRVSCPKNGTILDCFMGSGSTGLAAVYNGCNFIGFEQDEEYYNLSNKRLKEWLDTQNGIGTLFEGGYY